MSHFFQEKKINSSISFEWKWQDQEEEEKKTYKIHSDSSYMNWAIWWLIPVNNGFLSDEQTSEKYE